MRFVVARRARRTAGSGEEVLALLERLSDIDDLARIRFLTSHPRFVTPALLDAVAKLHATDDLQAVRVAAVEAAERKAGLR